MVKPASRAVALLIIVLVVTAAALPACARQSAQSSEKQVHLKTARSLDKKVSQLHSLIADEIDQWNNDVNNARTNDAHKSELYKNLRYGDGILEISINWYYDYIRQYNELTKAIDEREIPSGDVSAVKKSLKSTVSKLTEIDNMLREHQKKVNEYRQWLRDEFD